MNQKDAKALYEYGVEQRLKVSFEEVIKNFERVLELDPKDASAYYRISKAQENQGRTT